MNNTRAVLIERLGPPEVLVEREVPLRDPGSGEVHLRIEAAGVNFADLIMRMGLYGTVPPRPYSPGFEVAGQIVRVGTDVAGWREGDRAAALLRYGGYAHDAIVTADQLFPYPSSFTPAEAAGTSAPPLRGSDPAQVSRRGRRRGRPARTIAPVVSSPGGTPPRCT